MSAPSEGTVVWSTARSSWREALGSEPTLADLPAAEGLGACLAEADASYFVVAPDGLSLPQLTTVVGVPANGYALGASVQSASEATAWWCVSVPGLAEAVAGRAAPQSVHDERVRTGQPEVVDENTVRVRLSVPEDDPNGPLSILLGAPEAIAPGY
ncbi:hypothetical protein ACQBAT_09045 [Ornithinimicrobium sp. Y1847]|uniref:hypothetical protein n=1 Tax=unclassified Ornithinimicrobium TaxID=2615080 RepID=UPI003B685604